MKKALVILMALAMVFGAFADDLAAVTIKGDASFGYAYDLDTEKFGMTNGKSSSQEYSIQLVTKEIAKTTEGSGIWGELKIESTEAKIDQTGLTSSAAATLKTAKIHFSDILAVNILAPSLEVGKNSIAFVTGDFTAETTAAAANAAFTNGFTVEVALPGIADISVAVADDGEQVADDKDIGVKGTVDVKAVKDLTLKGEVAWNGDLDKGLAFGANIGYTLDKLTISGAFNRGYDEANTIAAGVLYKWGADKLEPKLDYIGDKCTDGASVAIATSDFSAIALGAAVFDSTFVPGLKAGAELKVKDVLKFGDDAADFAAVAAKYSTAFGDISLDANAGFKFNLNTNKFGLKYGASVSNKTLIQNTTLSLGYTGQHDADLGGTDAADKKGKITASAKIAF